MKKNIRHLLMLVTIFTVIFICVGCGKSPVLPSKMYGNWRMATVNEQSYSDFAREKNISANSVKWTIDEKTLSAYYPGADKPAEFPIFYIKTGFEILNPDYSLFVTVYYDRASDTLYYDMKIDGENYKYTLERIKE